MAQGSLCQNRPRRVDVSDGRDDVAAIVVAWLAWSPLCWCAWITVIDKPLLIIVEAKQDNFTQGWGQCLAAIVAAQKINETAEIEIFGIVTTGQMWQFGRLQADLFEQYERLVRREEAFGYINALVTQAETQARQQLQRESS
ncbi:MAG: hypothetical protein AAF639_11205 [Chloroflexota bacterium]